MFCKKIDPATEDHWNTIGVLFRSVTANLRYERLSVSHLVQVIFARFFSLLRPLQPKVVFDLLGKFFEFEKFGLAKSEAETVWKALLSTVEVWLSGQKVRGSAGQLYRFLHRKKGETSLRRHAKLL